MGDERGAGYGYGKAVMRERLVVDDYFLEVNYGMPTSLGEFDESPLTRACEN